MYMFHKTVSLPTTSPVDLDDLKDHLRLFGDDSVSDGYLNVLIDTAVTIASEHIGEGVGDHEIEAFYSDFDDLVLPHRHVASLGSIQYYNADNVLTTFDADSELTYLDSASEFPTIRLNQGESWPTDVHNDRPNPVVITYDNNILDNFTSPRITQAILMICADLYEEPQDQLVGGGPRSKAMLTASRLLRPYQKRRLGL